MNIFVFGSLNIDHTYRLPHMLRIGETLSSYEYSRNVGGKGLNQAIALRRAGSNVCFAGAIGADGIFLTDYLLENGTADEKENRIYSLDKLYDEIIK